MSAVYDYAVLEGDDASEDDYNEAMQRAINAGEAWKFQGSVGRAMMQALKDGRCVLGRKAAYDYFGNRIPSRDEVQAGSLGSVEYCADRSGAEYAAYISEI